MHYSSEELLLHDAAFRRITAAFCTLLHTFTAVFDFYCPGSAVYPEVGYTSPLHNRGVSAHENPSIQLKLLKGLGVHGNAPRVNPCNTNAVLGAFPPPSSLTVNEQVE